MMPIQAGSVERVPAWMIDSLGGLVKLTAMVDEYGDGTSIYPPGWVGTLDAVQAGQNGPHAVVEDLTTGVLVEVPLGALMPAKWVRGVL